MSASPVPAAIPAASRTGWLNPIIRRYARSRLRPKAMGVWLLALMLIAGCLFFAVRTSFLYRGHIPVVEAERVAAIPIFVLQAIILFFLGTGQAAAGITAEADEGTLDYQRLSPMSPLSKVFGYLFGLTIREWCLFAATLPFTIWSLWRGQVPTETWGQLYLALISSAVLYHLTGLVAGSVVKNRRWAFLVSIGVIILLYVVIPQAAKFGLVYFKYLTLWPVVDETIVGLMPSEAAGPMRLLQSMEPDVRFFGLHFSEAAFTLFSQSVLSLTFIVMLWRRWRRAESHLISKVWSVGLFIWMQLMLLGNALPLIEPGLLFPSRQFNRRYLRGQGNWEPQLWEAVAMIGLYGLVTLILLAVLTLIITPTEETQIRGLQRGRKLGWLRMPRLSDPASSFAFVAFMALAGAVGWTIFSQKLIGSHWFAGYALSGHAAFTFALVLLSAGLACQEILEGWGGHRLFLACVFIVVLPLVIGGIAAMVSDKAITPALWIAAISPASAPVYAVATLIPGMDWSGRMALAVPRAFWFWQVLTALATWWFLYRLRQIRQTRHAAVYGLPAPSPEKPEV